MVSDHSQSTGPRHLRERWITTGRRRFSIGVRKGVPADAWPYIALTAAVIIANALYLLGIVDANLLGPRSGLIATSTPGFLHGLNTIDPNAGFVSQAIGHRAALDVLHLQLPWWNPFEGTGAPLLGEMQSAGLFPLTLLTAFSNGQLYEHILLELVSGVGTYLLLRRLRLTRVVSTTAATAFALNGTFAWFQHAPVNPIPFLPLVLLGLELAYERSLTRRPGGWLLLAIAGALSVYAGFPETAYVDGLLAGLWFAWRLGCGTGFRKAFVVKCLTGVIVGALLAAPMLIASLNAVQNGNLAQNAGLVGNEALPVHGLSMLLLPYVFGPIFDYNDAHGVVFGIWGGVGGFLTSSLVLMALLGLLSSRRRGLKLVLLVWIVLSVARIYGYPTFLGGILGVLPGMSRVAFFRYAFPAVELAVIVLAALGLENLLGNRPAGRRLVLATGIALALVIAAAVSSMHIASELGHHHELYSGGSVVWAILVIVSIEAAALVRSASRRTMLLVAIVLLDVMALFVGPELSAPRSVKVDLAPVRYLQQHLGQHRFYTLGPLAPNYGSYFGLRELDAIDLPIPAAFTHFVRTRLDPYAVINRFVGNDSAGRPGAAPSTAAELMQNLAAYRNAGVAYVLTPTGQSLPQSPHGLQLVLRTASTWIYHLVGAAPYFTSSNSSCTLRTLGLQRVRVSCPAAAVLLRRETYFPGWSADVNGRAAPISKADGIYQAVQVPPGTSWVTFDFVPPHESWGLVAFLLGLVGLGAGAAISRRELSTRLPAEEPVPPTPVASESPQS